MPKTVIKIENLSKLYRIGEIGTGTISHDLNRWWTTKIRGKEDPFAKVGQVNDRTSKAEKGEHVWALKDINLEVKQGDILGIIGKNGAGKSTLLKLLSRVTSPTTGSIKVKGRMASLLEVGTGFHPEMTGRENIYMNGTIMGMRRWEIDKKLDEIVDFAGVAKYLDTPTKRYSSGMTVRLGFAIAAFLEPEILIVDEVLAVGDVEFQKKAIGKMQDVSKGEGRTVLFVSHNMASIKSLCLKGILLENGALKFYGLTDEILKLYMGGNNDSFNYRDLNYINKGFLIKDLGIRNTNRDFNDKIVRDEVILIEFNYVNESPDENIYWNLKIKDEEGRYLITTTSKHRKNYTMSGKGKALMKIPADFFNEGEFSIDLMVLSHSKKGYVIYVNERDVLMVRIFPEKRPMGSWMGKEPGSIRHKFEWV
ncbi:ABC transporter ATP-binding protein [Reichenbachiella sp. MALMAid0571]|uniref:ABC transporter ATP-binding protein n=1 Tax=Reichenbachiella sp. MALMAid0571 TaxID=3143939 RepID=UPI0032DEA5E9